MSQNGFVIRPKLETFPFFVETFPYSWFPMPGLEIWFPAQVLGAGICPDKLAASKTVTGGAAGDSHRRRQRPKAAPGICALEWSGDW
jgi:hypothetical protein